MRFCFDLDGVICSLRRPSETYDDVTPLPGAIETLKALRRQGHTVIIHTARHMKTQGGDVGRVLATQGLVTLNWLQDHDVEYDEIVFGKPWADVYIDDNAVRFSTWVDLNETLTQLT
jgi:capsule biosynthesis phosphatase